MTQPDYVPLAGPDRVRPSDRLTLPGSWTADRPADLRSLVLPDGAGFGHAGPDLGYGLKLAKRLVDRITLQPGEHAEDALAGCFACGTARASGFGRAPVIHDMTWAYSLWGYLGQPPAGLISARTPLFRGAGHHYEVQRAIVDRVADASFRLTPGQLTQALAGDWQGLFTGSFASA